MATLTTNYSFSKPTVGGDGDAWGGLLNDNWDDLDALLPSLAELAGAAFTGSVTVQDVVTLGSGGVTVTADATTPNADFLVTGESAENVLRLFSSSGAGRIEGPDEAVTGKSPKMTFQTDGTILVRSVDTVNDALRDASFDYADAYGLPDNTSVVTRQRGDARYIPAFRTVAEMVATTETFAVNDILLVPPFSYTVAPAAATDHDLTTAAGDKLYLNTTGGVLNLTGLGIANDASEDAAARLETTIQRYLTRDDLCLLILMPMGSFRIERRIVLDINNENLKVAIYGKGFVGIMNTDVDDGFMYIDTQRKSNIRIDGIDVESQIAEDAVDTTNGVAFTIVDSQGGQARRFQVTLYDVCVRGYDQDPNTGVWEGFCRMEGVQYPIIDTCIYENNLAVDFETLAPDEASDLAYLGIGYDFFECYWVKVLNTQTRGFMQYQIRIYDADGTHFEQFTIDNCGMAGDCWHGLLVDHPEYTSGQEPGGSISRSHLKGAAGAIKLRHLSEVIIGPALAIPKWFDNEKFSDGYKPPTGQRREIALHHCANVQILGVPLRGIGYYTDIDTCQVGIYLDEDCRDVEIVGYNYNGNDGVAIFNEMTGPGKDTLYINASAYVRTTKPDAGVILTPTHFLYNSNDSVPAIDGVRTRSVTPVPEFEGSSPTWTYTVDGGYTQTDQGWVEGWIEISFDTGSGALGTTYPLRFGGFPTGQTGKAVGTGSFSSIVDTDDPTGTGRFYTVNVENGYVYPKTQFDNNRLGDLHGAYVTNGSSFRMEFSYQSETVIIE